MNLLNKNNITKFYKIKNYLHSVFKFTKDKIRLQTEKKLIK